VFHVELRQFPNVTRVFNLSQGELEERILVPWLAGTVLEVNDRRWSVEKARLTIYEGAPLETGEMGLGRGWANATRAGREVTAEVLTEAQAAAITPLDRATAALKAEIVERVAVSALGLHEVLLLANERYPGWRVSERVAAAERSAWELLHEGRVRLARDGEPVVQAQWEAIVLDWDAWSGEAQPAPVLVA
jgi:hypothetical protein